MVSLASFNEQQRLLPSELENRLNSGLRRGAGAALIAIIGALWISLVTWSATDPSLTHSTSGEVTNSLGHTGAIVAGLLLETLGLAVAIALLAPMLWSLELLLSERVDNIRTKVLYYPLNVLSIAAVLSAIPRPDVWPIPHGLGGVLGDLVFEFATVLVTLVNSESAAPIAGLLLWVIAILLLNQGLGLKFGASSTVSVAARKPRNTSWGDETHDTHATTFDRAKSWAARPLEILDRTLRRSSVDRDDAPYAHAPEPQLHAANTRAPFWHETNTAADVHSGHAADIDHGPTLSPDAGLHTDAPGWGDLDSDPVDMSIAKRFAPANAAAARTHVHTTPAQHDHMHGEAGEPLPRFLGGGAAAQPVQQDLHAVTPEALAAAAPRAHAGPHAQPNSALSDGAKAPTPAQAASAPTAPRQQPAAPRRQAAAGTLKRPPTSLLQRLSGAKAKSGVSQTVLRGTARLLEDVLADFGVKGEIREVHPGPVVTLFELEPARGTKASRVIALADDIARSMSAKSARVAPIRGRNAIGIELSNATRDSVGLRDLFESNAYKSADGPLPIALGKSISGDPVIADLSRMPHLLVAGTTGSGKSVGINAMIMSLLFRHSPDQCRMIMIDPKMLELSVYNDIPHLLCPVITEPTKAVGALNWTVGEMEERYKRMSKISVRNIDAFNTKVKDAAERGTSLGRTVHTGYDDETGQPIYEREDIDLAPMPYIVVVVDEFADLMVTAGKEIEGSIQRLAQKARAAGIHLIMATQRPSVDIITGTIKANFPTRISYRVASKFDSRTILNEQGAEQLLGQGDMLFSTGSGQMVRVHGPFVSDEEVEATANHLRRQGKPRYVDGIDVEPEDQNSAKASRAQPAANGDSLYDRAVAVVLRDGKASTSYIQRRLSIGYNRAADLIERMEEEGLISAPNASGRREILSGERPSA